MLLWSRWPPGTRPGALHLYDGRVSSVASSNTAAHRGNVLAQLRACQAPQACPGARLWHTSAPLVRGPQRTSCKLQVRRGSGPMIDHTGVVVSNLELAKAFYRAALAPLGYQLLFELPGVASDGGE